MYAPQLGRFISRDPEGYFDGINQYEYVHSDPPNNVDPSGRTSWRCLFDTTAATTALMFANADLAVALVSILGPDEATGGATKVAELAALYASIKAAVAAVNDADQACKCDDNSAPTLKELKDDIKSLKDQYKGLKDMLKKLGKLAGGVIEHEG